MADAIVATHPRSAAAQSGFAAAVALAALSVHICFVTLTVLAAVLAPQVRIKRSRADGVLLEQPIAQLWLFPAWRCEQLLEASSAARARLESVLLLLVEQSGRIFSRDASQRASVR